MIYHILRSFQIYTLLLLYFYKFNLNILTNKFVFVRFGHIQRKNYFFIFSSILALKKNQRRHSFYMKKWFATFLNKNILIYNLFICKRNVHNFLQKKVTIMTFFGRKEWNLLLRQIFFFFFSSKITSPYITWIAPPPSPQKRTGRNVLTERQLAPLSTVSPQYIILWRS